MFPGCCDHLSAAARPTRRIMKRETCSTLLAIWPETNEHCALSKSSQLHRFAKGPRFPRNSLIYTAILHMMYTMHTIYSNRKCTIQIIYVIYGIGTLSATHAMLGMSVG